VNLEYGVVGMTGVAPGSTDGSWNHWTVMVVSPRLCPGSTSKMA
jgi:hypothetical protein